MMSARSIELNHDGKINIAIGKSRLDTNWKNREFTWSEFLKKISHPKRTNETFSEYLALPRKAQTDIKDSAGGFVGGVLQGGRRKSDAVKWRNLITLDADYAEPDLWDKIKKSHGYACAIYSTHKHRKDKPRYRILLPTSRPVTPDEYQCVARTKAGELGIDLFDDTTYEPHRLMFFPTVSSDAEYVFEYQDGPWLDPDEVLSQYENWRDQSFWPVSERTKKIHQSLLEKAENPLEKRGIVGQFCRTYTISAAIEKFIPDVYEESSEGRYTYLAGTTVGGLVVYDDDLFAFSHHSTDPTGGRLVNAFDLVRLHLYGDRDEGEEDSTPITRLPSYKLMTQLATEDEQVSEIAAVERIEQAGQDFSETDTSWLRKLERTENGRFAKNAHNLKWILRKDPHLVDKFGLNEFTGRISALGKLPWRSVEGEEGWSDVDDAGLRNYLSETYGISGKSIVLDAFVEIASKNKFHPVRHYLNGLEWDGTKRVDTMLIDYMGAADNKYTRTVTRKFLTAAVARIFKPGTKFDNVLTLQGKQGHNKSALVYKLGKSWGSDSFETFSGKEAYEQLQGSWLVEIGELAAMRRSELNAVKHFLTKQVDRFRVAYGHNVQDFPRQCVFFATTNDDTFLQDPTGERRWWVVPIDKDKAKKPFWKNLTEGVIDQIWAESVTLFEKGESLILPSDVESMAQEMQEAHSEADARLGVIIEFLGTKIQNGWYDLEDSTRRASKDFNDDAEDSGELRDRTCALEIWVDCFGNESSKLTKGVARELNTLLKKVPGWKPYGGKIRFGKAFGIQRAFIRDGRYQ